MSEALVENGFGRFKLSPQLMDYLAGLEIDTPTAVQTSAIPIIKAGQNLMAQAPTGSGKTLAFMLPVFHRLRGPGDGPPRVLVLAPTKELVVQLSQVAHRIGEGNGIKAVAVASGIAISNLRKLMAALPDVVVGTPAAVMDLYRDKSLSLGKIEYLILDEADRLVNGQMIQQINTLLEVLPRKRQTMLFSATISTAVERLASDFIEHYERVTHTAEEAIPMELSSCMPLRPMKRPKEI